MGQRLHLHPTTPQGRHLDRAVAVLGEGGVVVLPTDTCYALTALPGERRPLEAIARLKGIDGDHKLFSVIVPDLSHIARYARVDDAAYRVLRRHLPGPYTFVLPATRELPRILSARRKTIGLRVPDHQVAREVAERAGGIILATTLRLLDDELPLSDPDDIADRVGTAVDLFLDQGSGGVEPSTLVDLTGDAPVVLRAGAGDPQPFQ